MGVDVLLTGAGALLGQGILKALRLSSDTGRIIAADLSPLAVGLYLADAAYLLPRYTAPEYVDELIRVAIHERVAVILCGTDLELAVLSTNRARIEAATGARVVVSGPEAVAIADDKWLTQAFLVDNGFDAPRSALAADSAALVEQVGFPVIVKPRVGAGSVGLSVAHNAAELARALEVEGMVVQEYLRPDDQEYTVGALVFEGKCHGAVALKRTLRHGNTHTAVSDGYSEIEAYVAKVVERLPGAFGPINVQLRLTERGPVVFEFNARFSGTTPLRVELGWNEVEATLRHILTGAPIPEARMNRGLVLRFMSEVVVPLDQIATLRETQVLAHPAGRLLGLAPRPDPT